MATTETQNPKQKNIKTKEKIQCFERFYKEFFKNTIN